MSGGNISKKVSATIADLKGQPAVKLIFHKEKRTMWATRDHNGRIRYDRPQQVPRHLKQSVVPELFREIDRRQYGN